LTGQHKDTGTDDRADAEHRQIQSAERLFQCMFAGFACFGYDLIDWFSRKK
jgi:hypothetical protein